MEWRKPHLGAEADQHEDESGAKPQRVERARMRDHVVEHEGTAPHGARWLRRGQEKHAKQCEGDPHGGQHEVLPHCLERSPVSSVVDQRRDG